MNSTDAAMAELRRVCSGGSAAPLVEHEDHDTAPDWLYIALVVLLAFVVPGLVYLRGLP